jgi:CheY-like chemotaxis protein
LVVTDLRMPRADGVALIRKIRREAKSWVPVVVITSQTDLDGNGSKLSRLTEIPRSTLYGLLREMNLLDALEE